MLQPQVNLEIFEQRLREIEARIDTLQNSTRCDDIAVALRRHFAEFRDVLKEAPPVEGIAKVWRHDLERLEQCIGALVEKLANFEAQSDRQGEADRRIDALLEQLGELRARNESELAAVQQHIAANVADAIGNPEESIRRDVASLKEIQASVDRRTQDTFEAVYGTIEEVVDRLAAIESELRLLPEPPATTVRLRQAAAPELGADASLESGGNARVRVAPYAIDPIAASKPAAHPPSPPSPTLPRERGREGWGQAGDGRDGVAEPAEPVRAKFVAAARRAARAVVGEQRATPPHSCPPLPPSLTFPRSLERERRGAKEGEKSRQHGAQNSLVGMLFQRSGPHAKSATLGVSVALLVLAAFGVAVDLFYTPAGQQSVWAAVDVDDAAEPDEEPADSQQPPPDQAPTRPGANLDERALPAAVKANAPAEEGTRAQAPGRVSPEMTAPVRNVPPQVTPGRDPALQSASPATPAFTAAPLPPTIGSKALVTAASAGDPGACYEVALRFAQGRNTTQDLAMAAAWLERAAGGGLAPAQFRLAVMYEKGLGVQRDLREARRLYVAAATKGHAKAMHNLAVLYAGGLDGKPDYALASQWFRRAAAHGVVDSQYNLAILYARGLGVEHNFAESYKWFALAAKSGDKDAARKRDEVATRLDPKQLEIARLNAEAFVAVPQPDEATATKAPAGGWDQVAAAATTKSKAPARPERFSGR
jgi:localization factor PodJL